jgi:2-polyprenyl-3-methyl-5-hydroxy-6-metoxy-1,4-benzoquinol methylase
MSSLESIFQNPLDLFTKAIKRGSYFLRTGYWHTPERCCEGFPDDNFANHLKVYRFALQFAVDKDVLDVGSGTGYGIHAISQSCKSALGIDLSRQAIRYAKRKYQNSNLQYIRMNAESLAFDDKSFDLIISTENFEHLHDQRANLRETARVLRDDGALLLATPNPEMFLGIQNRYHTHEFVFEELLNLAREFYRDCVIAENLLEPNTPEGIRMKAERVARGAVGVNLAAKPIIWGRTIDNTWISNTHSFVCFCRFPLRNHH